LNNADVDLGQTYPPRSSDKYAEKAYTPLRNEFVDTIYSAMYTKKSYPSSPDSENLSPNDKFDIGRITPKLTK
jgi:hypothetical protein